MGQPDQLSTDPSPANAVTDSIVESQLPPASDASEVEKAGSTPGVQDDSSVGNSLETSEGPELPEGQKHATTAPFQSSSAAPKTPQNATKKGLVVIHGAGHQHQSETLQFMASPLIEWMSEWAEAHGCTLRVDDAALRFATEDDDPGQPPPHVHVSLGVIDSDGDTPIGDVDDDADLENKRKLIKPFDWTVAETWWAWSAISPPLVTIFVWMLKHGIHAIVAGLHNMSAHACSLWRECVHPKDPRINADTGYGQPESTPRWALWLDLVITAMTLALSPVVILVGILAMFLAVLLSQVPIDAVQNFALVGPLASFLTINGGQIYILANDEIQAANFRGRLERTIRWLSDHERCKEIYIMAHSLGCIVSYETLCALGDIWTVTPYPDVVKLFTMGDGLNLAWRLEPQQWWKQPHQWRLFVPLQGSIDWYDFWSEQDPVPSGPIRIPAHVVKHVKGLMARLSVKPAYQELFLGRDKDTNPKMAETRRMQPQGSVNVTNWMDILADHGGYWDNDEEVLSRVACEIDAGRSGNLSDSSFYQSWYAISGRSARRARVALLTLIRLMFYTLLFAAVLQTKTQHMGQTVMNNLAQLPGLKPLADAAHQAITAIVSRLDLNSKTPFFGGIGWIFYVLPAVLVLLVPLLLLYNSVARTCWQQWDKRQSIERMRLAVQNQLGLARSGDQHITLIRTAKAGEKPRYWGWLATAFALPLLALVVGLVLLKVGFAEAVVWTIVTLFILLPPAVITVVTLLFLLPRLMQFIVSLFKLLHRMWSRMAPHQAPSVSP